MPLLSRVVCLLFGLAALISPLAAQGIDLYEGEIPVAGQGAEERTAALPGAMGQMLVRLSGDATVAADPALRPLLDQAGALVQRYRYRQQVEVQGGLPVNRTWLVARFDPARVDAALAAAGVAVWLPPRPRPLVWLVIDDGSGPRVLGAAQAAAVSALAARARQRGLDLRYPGLDAQEQGLMSAIWTGRVEVLAEASARYDAPALLLGRLQRQGEGWNARWKAVEGGRALQSIEVRDAQAQTVLAQGADLLADALAARYRLVAGGAVESVRIALLELAPPDDYARVMAYLQRLPGMQSVQPQRADGQRLEIDLQLAGGAARLERLIALARMLEPAGAPLEYRLRR